MAIKRIIIPFLIFLATLMAPSARPESAALPPIIFDAHEDCLRRVLDRGDDLAEPTQDTDAQGDIASWKAGGVNVVWFAAWVNPERYYGRAGTQRTENLIAAFKRQISRHPNDLVFCQTAAECRATAANGKIAALLGIEGGSALNDNISLVAHFRKLGVRRITLTWRGNIGWAGSSQSAGPAMGLTEMGRAMIREMNRTGIVPDLSHVSDQTFCGTIAVSSLPVILSHSNARALANHPRNVSDDMLALLRQNGGVIGVNFHSEFLASPAGMFSRKTSQPTIESVLDQISHIARVAGVDHVGFGSDWDGDIQPARGLETAAAMPLLISGLRRRGFSEKNIRKIAGENFLRVLEANEQQTGRQTETGN
ncbi:MAG: dipeptidase [Candidatus Sumerlaeota bacterium]|nr:dipeptidase [Candidatus Sumerlaeota bacterium]